MSIKNQFLNSKPRITKVVIDGVGEVFVRSLTCEQMTQIQNTPDEDRVLTEFCLGLCDEHGEQVFDLEKDQEEIKKIHLHHLVEVVNEIGKNSTLVSKIDAAKKN